MTLLNEEEIGLRHAIDKFARLLQDVSLLQLARRRVFQGQVIELLSFIQSLEEADAGGGHNAALEEALITLRLVLDDAIVLLNRQFEEIVAEFKQEQENKA
ncbi:MAG: hypothetical protein IPL87_00200 [Candidatus Moraniibacteriota bacterium]|nr:MAG: hypothetical protein IPL87_00200 [Candidatus Moranbacteria bacterium]